jgi:hypothetical protein
MCRTYIYMQLVLSVFVDLNRILDYVHLTLAVRALVFLNFLQRVIFHLRLNLLYIILVLIIRPLLHLILLLSNIGFMRNISQLDALRLPWQVSGLLHNYRLNRNVLNLLRLDHPRLFLNLNWNIRHRSLDVMISSKIVLLRVTDRLNWLDLWLNQNWNSSL